ncbi:hypothetical protein A2950_01470 [Candidatus Kaiserbacteria bacterium RIFCSPLOWO2_01_FULL_55_19]|uniref:Uncharacterized protein n=1 Tax=Candidatus Kaiserbacteria bacterium RIFCSPLOWO2_01_FULL_55_19 TaxID=1798516 RepID=A0A1F6ERL3_9BACT|nr:MAG: hypothetical protein A2950_01470 [Candidatus Kaiserbacteria bacterium RIFCSPLOWO2_01_FULL_55_19]
MHVVGTVLGVGAATFAEIYYTRFNSDNILTDDERRTLAVTYTVLRTGLFLLVISGFAFLLYFRLTEHVGALTSPSFWAKMTIIGILVGNALLLQARIMPLAIGSAISLTSWYAALVLGVIGKTDATYGELFMYYALATLLVGVILRWIRTRLHAPTTI